MIAPAVTEISALRTSSTISAGSSPPVAARLPAPRPGLQNGLGDRLEKTGDQTRPTGK